MIHSSGSQPLLSSMLYQMGPSIIFFGLWTSSSCIINLQLSQVGGELWCRVQSHHQSLVSYCDINTFVIMFVCSFYSKANICGYMFLFSKLAEILHSIHSHVCHFSLMSHGGKLRCCYLQDNVVLLCSRLEIIWIQGIWQAVIISQLMVKWEIDQKL